VKRGTRRDLRARCRVNLYRCPPCPILPSPSFVFPIDRRSRLEIRILAPTNSPAFSIAFATVTKRGGGGGGGEGGGGSPYSRGLLSSHTASYVNFSFFSLRFASLFLIPRLSLLTKLFHDADIFITVPVWLNFCTFPISYWLTQGTLTPIFFVNLYVQSSTYITPFNFIFLIHICPKIRF
jgi:hypothetical protein